MWSGRRDSNPRPQPWQGRVLGRMRTVHQHPSLFLGQCDVATREPRRSPILDDLNKSGSAQPRLPSQRGRLSHQARRPLEATVWRISASFGDGRTEVPFGPWLFMISSSHRHIRDCWEIPRVFEREGCRRVARSAPLTLSPLRRHPPVEEEFYRREAQPPRLPLSKVLRRESPGPRRSPTPSADRTAPAIRPLPR